MDDDSTPDSWDAVEDPGPSTSQNIPTAFNTLNINAKPFVPNVNAPVFVPSFCKGQDSNGKKRIEKLPHVFSSVII